MSDRFKSTLSIRVDVEVEVEDEDELTQLRSSLEQRAWDMCNTFWGNPEVLGVASIRRTRVVPQDAPVTE